MPAFLKFLFWMSSDWIHFSGLKISLRVIIQRRVNIHYSTIFYVVNYTAECARGDWSSDSQVRWGRRKAVYPCLYSATLQKTDYHILNMVQSRPSILTLPVQLNRAKHFRHQDANYNWWTARDTRFCLNIIMQLFHRIFSLIQYIFNYFYFLSFIVPLRRRDIWRAQLRRSEAMKPLRRSNYFSLGHPIEICFHISSHSCFMSILQEVYNSQPKVVFKY